ncbi:hypothetical protein N7489_006060 [Penicillium chrysogenum]|uniref:uncharacterized protein n=1 Tax=Penicillium chrysogenum TaxID=5076 RepID=UPI00239F06BC|nr:uncharacterized protein N7489_006060 [Penicillium chrysogenum]KAJ5235969.1 hypothetical protein N7489_006060 [Penicillium chrysogenum]KAJ5275907.1 hypothetical protein N7524_002060 [Penicillium chrysogenum]
MPLQVRDTGALKSYDAIPEEEWLYEDIDLQCVRRAHRATIQKALRLNVEEGVPRNQVEELADPNRLERNDDSARV